MTRPEPDRPERGRLDRERAPLRGLELWLDTLRALCLPRRAVAVALVTAALLAAQWWFQPRLGPMLAAVVVTAAFLLLSPFTWRALFPEGSVRRFDRLALYGAVACLPAGLSLGLREVLGVDETLLTDGVNLLVTASLSAVGGYGLARDIQFESGLERARARADELERQAERAELLALRMHLDPHFLFNTLGALAEWTREDPETAERGILRLADLLREVMGGVRAAAWPLERELRLARAVWELHALRDPVRYAHTVELPDPVPALAVPPLVLLPLVENAVKHGPGAGHAGPLELRVGPAIEAGAEDPARLAIEVENPGPYAGPRAGGEGLELVRRRLAQGFGDGVRLSLEARGGRTLARLVLPRTEAAAPGARAPGTDAPRSSNTPHTPNARPNAAEGPA